MKLEHQEDACGGRTTWVFSYYTMELESTRLDNFDRALIKECEESDSVADKLLALECIARRIEEQEKSGK